MNPALKNRLVGASLAAVVLVFVAATIRMMLSPMVVPTVADMLLINPHDRIGTVRVLGKTSAGDWGGGKDFRLVATSSISVTNDVQIVSPVNTNWAFAHDWDGDPRAFGAIPYNARHTAVPWGFKSNIGAIGTNDFSVWARTTIPSTYTRNSGLLGIGPSTGDTNNPASFQAAAFQFRSTPTGFGFLLRGTDSSSTPGSTLNEASSLDASPGTFSSYFGQVVNIVFTRSGTTVKCYFNGTDVTSSFTVNNAAGWAKSLGLGFGLMASSGHNDNLWYWPNPVTRFAVWTNALSAGQAANPESAGSKIVDFTPTDISVPVDSGEAINRAIDYLSTLGGGEIILPRGSYRISTTIRPKKNVSIRGGGAAYYPSTATGVVGFSPATTTLVPWFENGGDVIGIRRSDLEETLLTSRNFNGIGGYSRNLSARVTLNGFTIFGGLAAYGNAISIDRSGSVTIRDVSVVAMPGCALYAVIPNTLLLDGFSGTGGRGVVIRGAADCKIVNCFYDGSMGPALWLNGNFDTVASCVFEYAGNPRIGADAFELVTTVDASTDTFTTAGNHRLQTGDLVRFVAASGTLPTGISEGTDYFIYRVDGTRFKISTVYADDITGLGVMTGSGFTDITTSGSGTWYVGPGPSVGMLFSGAIGAIGDNVGIIGNRSAQNFLEAVRLEYSHSMRLGENRFTLSGRGNTNLTNLANINLVSSYDNSIIGNTSNDRYQNGWATNGIYIDANSYGNFIAGNSHRGSANFVPYVVQNSSNYISDANGTIFPGTSSRSSLLIPSSSSFSPYADARATNGAVPMIYHTGTRRLYIARDSSGTNWDYLATAPVAGPIFWQSSASSGGYNGVNVGAANEFMSFTGAAISPMLRISAFSAVPTLSAIMGFLRNAAASSGSFAALPNDYELGRLQFGGYFTNNSAGNVPQSVEIIPKTAEPWETGRTGSKLVVTVTPTNSTAKAEALTISFPAAANTNQSTFTVPFNGVNLRLSLTNESGVLRAIFLP
jgi:hypothetical protein